MRHYGWLSGAAKAKWQRILALLDWKTPPLTLPARTSTAPLCALCAKPMRLIGTLPPLSALMRMPENCKSTLEKSPAQKDQRGCGAVCRRD